MDLIVISISRIYFKWMNGTIQNCECILFKYLFLVALGFGQRKRTSDSIAKIQLAKGITA